MACFPKRTHLNCQQLPASVRSSSLFGNFENQTSLFDPHHLPFTFRRFIFLEPMTNKKYLDVCRCKSKCCWNYILHWDVEPHTTAMKKCLIWALCFRWGDLGGHITASGRIQVCLLFFHLCIFFSFWQWHASLFIQIKWFIGCSIICTCSTLPIVAR